MCKLLSLENYSRRDEPITFIIQEKYYKDIKGPCHYWKVGKKIEIGTYFKYKRDKY